MKHKGVNQIGWGLFPYRGRYWFNNLRDVPCLLKRLFFVMKHGYAPQARWETYNWFIDVFREILSYYNDEANGIPNVIPDGDPESNSELFNRIVVEMRGYLDDMDEQNPKYRDWDSRKIFDAQTSAKCGFFELFSKYFYFFWD